MRQSSLTVRSRERERRTNKQSLVWKEGKTRRDNSQVLSWCLEKFILWIKMFRLKFIQRSRDVKDLFQDWLRCYPLPSPSKNKKKKNGKKDYHFPGWPWTAACFHIPSEGFFFHGISCFGMRRGALERVLTMINLATVPPLMTHRILTREPSQRPPWCACNPFCWRVMLKPSSASVTDPWVSPDGTHYETLGCGRVPLTSLSTTGAKVSLGTEGPSAQVMRWKYSIASMSWHWWWHSAWRSRPLGKSVW